ncbi:hypothetical protein L7F22_061706 [Adiantum nelumboides]|nr:hypothetical protein [Adiantum nelumboides]
MDLPGNVLSEYKCLTVLKECIKLKSLGQARRAYTYFMLLTLEPAIVVQEHLVLVFAKLGSLDDALYVFNRLLRRTAFSWTAMISGFTDYDQAYDAIGMYQHMLKEGVEPDRFTFISLFKACGSIGDLKQGKELHFEAQRLDFASNTFVSNTLISMYGKCGGVVEAEDVFHGLTIHSVVSWTAMITVYVENNQAEKGLLLFRQMQKEGMSPNDQTFVGAIQACGILAEMEDVSNKDGEATKAMSLELGKALHVEAWRGGFSSDAYIVTTLVSMYGKCGTLLEAEATFSTLAKHNVASWTAMISAYVENGHGEKALLVYRQMQEEGVSPNEHTLVCALQACDTLKSSDGVVGEANKSRPWEIGQALHADAHTRSFASREVLGNALVSMYGKYGVIKEAEHVFIGLSQRSVISWTAMLSAYVDQGKPERALQTYKQMHEAGAYPNQQTLVMAIQACDTFAENDEASTGTHREQSSVSICLKICQSLHVDAERIGLASDVFVGSALLSIYAKCGAFSQAKEVFCTLPRQDTGSWNAMLSAFVEHDRGEMALHLYRHMLEEKVTLDSITFMNVLQACNKICILNLCREVHFIIVSTSNDSNVLLTSSLIHTYGSCSSMQDGETTLVEMPQPDAVSWNACVASYAEAGDCEASSHILEAMLLACMRPDGITFASLLSASNHGGLVAEGREYFECMHEDYGLNPDFKHFAGVIDLLGRAGDFKRLENVLWGLPKPPDLAIWLSLLGSCYKHNNMDLGNFALLNAMKLQSNMVLTFDCMPSLSSDIALEV